MAHETAVDVLIAGGGPFGLMLANELGRRGVTAAVVDAKPSTAVNPQANATQARTMEHYRRLGFAEEVRALGLPSDFPTDVAYFTRFGAYELARFHLPSAREAREAVRRLSGSWSAAELPHRVSQKYVEQVLRRHAEALPGISVNFGWELTGFAQTAERVTASLAGRDGRRACSVTARYLVGADGARSFVRRELGIGWTGETGVLRDFFGGRMYAIHLSAPHFYDVARHPPAWMQVTFNRDRRAFMAAVDGRGESAFHTQLRAGEDERRITERDALGMFRAAVGADIEATILSRAGWTAGHALVAERFRRGRVLLGGDAAHLFTPAGGLGYNTAVEDAVNLGWKLAADLHGAGGAGLVDSYERERRPAAGRNIAYARRFAESLGSYTAADGIEEDTPLGAELRRSWPGAGARTPMPTPSPPGSPATAPARNRPAPVARSPLAAASSRPSWSRCVTSSRSASSRRRRRSICARWESTLLVSAGPRGLDIELAPADLVSLTVRHRPKAPARHGPRIAPPGGGVDAAG